MLLTNAEHAPDETEALRMYTKLTDLMDKSITARDTKYRQKRERFFVSVIFFSFVLQLAKIKTMLCVKRPSRRIESTQSYASVCVSVSVCRFACVCLYLYVCAIHPSIVVGDSEIRAAYRGRGRSVCLQYSHDIQRQ